jgi:hypothetical protein
MKNRRNTATLLGLRLTGAALLGAGILSLGAGDAGASAPRKLPVSYYEAHPCALVTQSEVTSAFGSPVEPGRRVLAPHSVACAYQSPQNSDNAEYYLRPGTLAAMKKRYLGPFTTERAAGHGAICDGELEVLFASAGTVRGHPFYLEVAPGSCTTAVQLARDAFARLS